MRKFVQRLVPVASFALLAGLIAIIVPTNTYAGLVSAKKISPVAPASSSEITPPRSENSLHGHGHPSLCVNGPSNCAVPPGAPCFITNPEGSCSFACVLAGCPPIVSGNCVLQEADGVACTYSCDFPYCSDGDLGP